MPDLDPDPPMIPDPANKFCILVVPDPQHCRIEKLFVAVLESDVLCTTNFW
jgi:hypothetical protein